MLLWKQGFLIHSLLAYYLQVSYMYHHQEQTSQPFPSTTCCSRQLNQVRLNLLQLLKKKLQHKHLQDIISLLPAPCLPTKKTSLRLNIKNNQPKTNKKQTRGSSSCCSTSAEEGNYRIPYGTCVTGIFSSFIFHVLFTQCGSCTLKPC